MNTNTTGTVHATTNIDDYDSIIQGFQTQGARYEDKKFIRYQHDIIALDIKTLTYGQVDKITTHLATEWSMILLLQYMMLIKAGIITRLLPIVNVLLIFSLTILFSPYLPCFRYRNLE